MMMMAIAATAAPAEIEAWARHRIEWPGVIIRVWVIAVVIGIWIRRRIDRIGRGGINRWRIIITGCRIGRLCISGCRIALHHGLPVASRGHALLIGDIIAFLHIAGGIRRIADADRTA